MLVCDWPLLLSEALVGRGASCRRTDRRPTAGLGSIGQVHRRPTVHGLGRQLEGELRRPGAAISPRTVAGFRAWS